MKTKRRSETSGWTINLVGCDPVLTERVRASLRRGPFSFLATDEPLPEGEADLCVAPARAAGDLAGLCAAPVIAFGSAGLLRSSLLAGCADYLREPWAPEELELRALAVLARTARRFRFPWGEVSPAGDTLRTPAGSVRFTHHEAAILRALLRARGRPVPRDALAYALGGRPDRARGRAIDVHVASVRRKARGLDPAAGRFIVAVRGQGYMVEEDSP